MIEVLITEDAEQDYRDSFCWYARRSQKAAEGFELELEHALEAIAANPTRYPRCDDRHRFYLLKRFPFQVIYRLLGENRCLVVAVAHTSRRPGYWRAR